MLNSTQARRIHYTLRIAVAMCFIGHGSFGIITKPVWCNYFAVFGIGHDMAYRLMPVLGGFDILLGLWMLVYPMRAIPAWLVIWGFVTALLRPLSGEPFAELIERAGNYGAPLALLFLSGPRLSDNIFSPVDPGVLPDTRQSARLLVLLRIIVFLLLAGHGWLNLIGKKGLLDQYAGLGFSDPRLVALRVGLFEVILAFSALVPSFRVLLPLVLVWKMASELLYPHYELFEWIERGGSYGAILALWLAEAPHLFSDLIRGRDRHETGPSPIRFS